MGVWGTDSDNDKGGADPRLNTLDYYKVSWSGADWYLQNFYGRNDIYIDDIQALAACAVPVPGAVLLGMLGLSFAGARLRKMKA